MVQQEEWIWLFSDDDVMDVNCVADFYKQLSINSVFDIYRFDLNLIDSKGQIIKNSKENNYPFLIDFFTFYKKRLSGELNSFVVEYIFRKEKFIEVGRFQNFDLAWGSDVATWVKISSENGISTIPDSKVNWRSSAENISPNNTEPIVIRKINSIIDFLFWSNEYFKNKRMNVNLFNHLVFLKRLKYFTHYIPDHELKKLLKRYAARSSNPRIIYFGLKYFLKLL
jgi:hypothetical protein